MFEHGRSIWPHSEFQKFPVGNWIPYFRACWEIELFIIEHVGNWIPYFRACWEIEFLIIKHAGKWIPYFRARWKLNTCLMVGHVNGKSPQWCEGLEGWSQAKVQNDYGSGRGSTCKQRFSERVSSSDQLLSRTLKGSSESHSDAPEKQDVQLWLLRFRKHWRILGWNGTQKHFKTPKEPFISSQ
jgi:hypothetical protein